MKLYSQALCKPGTQFSHVSDNCGHNNTYYHVYEVTFSVHSIVNMGNLKAPECIKRQPAPQSCNRQ